MKIGTAASLGAMTSTAPQEHAPGLRDHPNEPRRNVLVVVADDLNRFDIAPYVPTPNLERMARAGVDFTRAYVPGPLCSLARYGLMLGAYPRRGGLGRIIGSVNPPPLDNPGPIVEHRGWSLPRAFAGAGFRTALFGKWHLGFPDGIEFPSNDRVFYQPHFFGFHDWLFGSPSNLNSQGSGYNDWLRVDNGRQSQESGWPELLRLDGILEWWSQHADVNKLCVWSMNLPHAPFSVPPALALPPGYVPDGSNPRSRYEAMIVSMDHMLGQILRHIDLSNTTVVWFGDNGTPPNVAGPNQSFDKVKKTTFEGGIRVPMRILGPGLPRGITFDGLTSLVDLGPSLASLLGVPSGGLDAIPGIFEGVRTGLPYRDWVMAERFLNRGEEPPKIEEEPNSELAIVTERYKYRLVNQVARVYDLQSDPGEDSPIHPEDPSVTAFVQFAQKRIDSLPPRLA